MNLLNRLHEMLCMELGATVASDQLGLINHGKCRVASIQDKPDSVVISTEDTDSYNEWFSQGEPLFGLWGFMMIATNQNSIWKTAGVRSNGNFRTFTIENGDECVIVIFHGFRKTDRENDSNQDPMEDLMRFVRARKTRPRKIALAFIGQRTEERHGILTRETCKHYETETWEREKRFDGFYNSFSQIINESVIECDSEFIFWIHPRVTVTFEMLDELVMLLCSGYAFVSEVNFGFFGCSKQVFRKIGMLDERFLGSEHEDTDWFFRLKMQGIPFFERGNQEICPTDPHKWPPMRGLAHTLFEEKWVRRHDDLDVWEWPYNWSLSKFYKSEKRFDDRKERKDIESGWSDFGQSYGASFIPRLTLSCTFHENDLDEKYEIADLTIDIRFDRNGFFSEFKCPIKTYIVMTIHDRDGIVLARFRLLSNSWALDNLNSVKDEEFVEIRVNCGQYRVFHGFCKRGYAQSITTGARIKTVKYNNPQQ